MGAVSQVTNGISGVIGLNGSGGGLLGSLGANGAGAAGTPPAPQDFVGAANATAAGNLANAQAATLANRTSQSGPGGSSSWTKNPDGTWTQNSALSGNGQSIYNQAQGGLTAGNLATSAGDPNAINQQAADAVYNQQTQYLDPQFKQSDQALASQLANQGIAPGSEAYNNAMLNQSNAKQQAYSNAANNATTQGASVAQGLYGMNLSNANLNNSAAQQTLTSNLGIMGGLNSAIPGAAQYNQQAVPGADLLGAANAANANTVAANNASIASSNATKGGLFQLGGSALIAASDIRLKKNIKRIGTHALGIGIYAYDYIWDKSAIGVMAQEVLKVKPEAVIIMPNGYYAVNYGAL